METKINKWLRENKTLSMFLMIFLVSGMVFAGVISPNVNDNIKDWFITKNITTTDISDKTLDEVIDGSYKTIILDLGDGEKPYSAIVIDEYEVKPSMEDLYTIYTCTSERNSTTARACESLTNKSSVCNFETKSWECVNNTWIEE